MMYKKNNFGYASKDVVNNLWIVRTIPRKSYEFQLRFYTYTGVGCTHPLSEGGVDSLAGVAFNLNLIPWNTTKDRLVRLVCKFFSSVPGIFEK
jgi:hypothetical protein